MHFDIDVMSTLLIASGVLLIGRLAIARIDFLRRYNIPEPVIGGLVAAVVITTLKVTAGVEIAFDMALQTPLMLAFFASIGLGADLRMLALGGRAIVAFLVVVAVMLVLQNAIGVAAAIGMDLHPLTGLLAGSITMSGGHGTGAAYASRFGSVDNLQGAMELAMACATFGLVLGGLIGGPIAQRLIANHGLTPEAKTAAASVPGELGGDERRTITPESFVETLFLMVVCVLAGIYLADITMNPYFALPSFVWTLFTGVVVRNTLTLTGFRRMDSAAVDLLGTVSLSLFLAMALIALRLWELVALALPILAILVAQLALVAAYTTFVTFTVMRKVLGSGYDAAAVVAGHCGFGLGATPTAVANMQAVTARYGPSPQAFLIVPLTGAFLIDITNALVIQGFLALPLFGF